MPKWFFLILLILFPPADLLFPGPAASASPEAEIAQLLARVEASGLVFVRNGQEYSSREAAEHLRRKKEYFQEKIKTAEDFIRLAASRSLMTGRPYLVKKPDGSTEAVQVWLTRELKGLRRGK